MEKGMDRAETFVGQIELSLFGRGEDTPLGSLGLSYSLGTVAVVYAKAREGGKGDPLLEELEEGAMAGWSIDAIGEAADGIAAGASAEGGALARELLRMRRVGEAIRRRCCAEGSLGWTDEVELRGQGPWRFEEMLGEDSAYRGIWIGEGLMRNEQGCGALGREGALEAVLRIAGEIAEKEGLEAAVVLAIEKHRQLDREAAMRSAQERALALEEARALGAMSMKAERKAKSPRL